MSCKTIVIVAIAIALPIPQAGAEEPSSQTAPPRAEATLLAPKAFRAAAAKIAPMLVRIEGFGGIAAGADGGAYQAPGEGPTTGLIVSPEGHILTSTFNFLRKPPIITVVFANGTRFVANLLGRDETRKICLLKVDGVSDLPVPESAPRSVLRVGQWALATGVGFGAKEPVISAGIISAISRASGKAVQTDVNTSPANYGGPLVDLQGRVIGLCVPLSPGSSREAAGAEWYDSGIGFAIPLNGLEKILDRMKAGETLREAFLGVQAETSGDPPSGAIIKEVVPDSPAAKAGVQIGAKIISVDDIDVVDPTHLATLIHRYVAGDKVSIVLDSNGRRKSIEVELTSPPPPAQPGPPSKEKAKEPREPKPRPAAPRTSARS